MACEAAALYGATPGRDEFDSRDVWDRDDALDAVSEAFRIMAQGIAPDGFQLADERESLLWGFVNMMDAQTQRLDRAADRLLPDLRDLQRAQDGTEIKSRELELTTARAQNLTDRRDAFEIMRDTAADAYRAETGSVWRPRRGSHTSQTGKLTSAAIDARDFMRARKDRETMAHLPQGTLVAIAGGKDVADPAAVIARLDKAREKYADMVLVHGGGPGVEKIAARWAERNGVQQVVCKPDWDKHGRAAPFRRNDDLLNLLPKGVIAFPGSAASPRTLSTRRGSLASRFSASRHSPQRPERAALLRQRGPFAVPADGVAATPPPSAPCFARVHRPPRRPLPLNRRSGSDPPGSPASISRSPVHRESGFDRPWPALGVTPHASVMQAYQRVPWRRPFGVFGCHQGPWGCWSERVSRATRGSSPACTRMAPCFTPRNSGATRRVSDRVR